MGMIPEMDKQSCCAPKSLANKHGSKNRIAEVEGGKLLKFSECGKSKRGDKIAKNIMATDLRDMPSPDVPDGYYSTDHEGGAS